jgi:NAD dependent epimerase/dehydratase family enzyme
MTDNKTSDKSGVLITGGSGFVGKQFTSLLLSNGYKVVHLSRSSRHNQEVPVFRWDPEKRVVDTDAFEDIDIVVHLAGANIGAKRWFRKRKAEIIRSRVDTTKLLFDTITERSDAIIEESPQKK